MSGTPSSARRMWSLLEPVHAVTYFAPEARAHFEAAGLRGFWRGYFAGRAAPLGPVAAAPVTALFFSFSPAMTTRALPAVWSLADPPAALAARAAGARAALTRVLAADGEGPAPGPLAEAAGLAREAASSVTTDGRALAAANAALPWPQDPLDVLWQAATVLREHRGDGHTAALVAAGVSGLEILALRSGLDLRREVLQPARGWTDGEWDAATGRLRDRGLLDDAATPGATPAGRALVADLERTTDTLAAQPWTAIGAAATERLAELVSPLARAARASLPAQNAIGLPALPDRGPG